MVENRKTYDIITNIILVLLCICCTIFIIDFIILYLGKQPGPGWIFFHTEGIQYSGV